MKPPPAAVPRSSLLLHLALSDVCSGVSFYDGEDAGTPPKQNKELEEGQALAFVFIPFQTHT